MINQYYKIFTSIAISFLLISCSNLFSIGSNSFNCDKNKEKCIPASKQATKLDQNQEINNEELNKLISTNNFYQLEIEPIKQNSTNRNIKSLITNDLVYVHPTFLKVWIAPYEDAENNIFLGSFFILQLDHGKWFKH